MTNIGIFDSAVRITVGGALAAAPLSTLVVPALAGMGYWVWSLLAVGAVLVHTGLSRFCPIYALLHLSSCGSK